MSAIDRPARLLDPGQCLTLRPMVYPRFYEMYRDAIKNTWTVEEFDFATDVGDCFAACIEGLFFFGAFAYVYFLRSRGLLHGLAAGTSWVFRDESAHMAFAFEVVDTVRREEPELFDDELTAAVFAMIDEAIACETAFAEDLLGGGVAGLSVENVRGYLEFCADQRLARLGLRGGIWGRIRCRSWTSRTSRRSRTSSSAACRRTRSASWARLAWTRRSER